MAPAEPIVEADSTLEAVGCLSECPMWALVPLLASANPNRREEVAVAARAAWMEVCRIPEDAPIFPVRRSWLPPSHLLLDTVCPAVVGRSRAFPSVSVRQCANANRHSKTPGPWNVRVPGPTVAPRLLIRYSPLQLWPPLGAFHTLARIHTKPVPNQQDLFELAFVPLAMEVLGSHSMMDLPMILLQQDDPM
jgi:hypothetical protein